MPGFARCRWLLGACGVLAAVACDQPKQMPVAKRVMHGDAARGAVLVRDYGCAVCHRIPGVRAFGGAVGPPLGGLVDRVYIAGGLTNRPDMVVQFIVNPPFLKPSTAMPNMGVTWTEARDMTAFLYTLPDKPR